MENNSPPTLKSDEKEIAHALWTDLYRGKPDAHSQLMAVPEHIRHAILTALMVSIEAGKTPNNPFD